MGVQITTDRLQALNTTIRTTFYNSYDGSTAWHPRLVAMVPSDSRSNVYPVAIDAGPVRDWTSGEREVDSLQLGSYEIFNKRYQKSLGINRDDLMDDKTGALITRARDYGAKFKKHPDHMVAGILKTNPKGLDGVALFHASHPRNPAASDGKSYKNLYTSAALSAANLALVRAKMMSLVGPDGEPLDNDPRLIIVPPDLEYLARTLAFGTIIPNAGGTAAQSNVLVSMFEILVIPQLVDPDDATSLTTWYLADVGTPDRPIIMQPHSPLEVVAQFDPGAPRVVTHNEYFWGATIRYGFGPGNPYRIAKCTVA